MNNILAVMLGLLRQKFDAGMNLELHESILATNDTYLEERNDWRDRFWGVHTDGNGLNTLGQLLMQVRIEIQPS